jgi:hypothetical protein
LFPVTLSQHGPHDGAIQWRMLPPPQKNRACYDDG